MFATSARLDGLPAGEKTNATVARTAATAGQNILRDGEILSHHARRVTRRPRAARDNISPRISFKFQVAGFKLQVSSCRFQV
jgi:hypothetical protein